ncbi:hypothetical protein EYF80_017756 [Liparis tanakae]|uniref:Uncharacterized protein n=1 Tax=Liparis tanakae TaxID=230148 RepID=A0A4Z2I204_9TELE|nr:hypothetical protein EYF80_017756 [Liparis tanakae]
MPYRSYLLPYENSSRIITTLKVESWESFRDSGRVQNGFVSLLMTWPLEHLVVYVSGYRVESRCVSVTSDPSGQHQQRMDGRHVPDPVGRQLGRILQLLGPEDYPDFITCTTRDCLPPRQLIPPKENITLK